MAFAFESVAYCLVHSRWYLVEGLFPSLEHKQTHTSLFSRLLVLLVAPSNRSEDSVVPEVVIDTSFIFCFISARTTAPTARSNPDSNVKVAAKW